MWYCLKRDDLREADPPYGMQLGRWYEDTRGADMEGDVPTAFLNIDGIETSVPRHELMFAEKKPDYSFNYVPGFVPPAPAGPRRWHGCPFAPKATEVSPSRRSRRSTLVVTVDARIQSRARIPPWCSGGRKTFRAVSRLPHLFGNGFGNAPLEKHANQRNHLRTAPAESPRRATQ